MNLVLVVAASTIREHSRRKLLAFFTIISALITAGLLYFATSASTEDFFEAATGGARFIAAGFFGTFALIAAIATSMGNVGRPFRSGEALLVLARPVSRAQYVLGRFIAGVAVTWMLVALFAAEIQIVELVGPGKSSGLLLEHWGVTALNLSIVSGVATLLSVFISTPIVAAILAYLINQVIGVAEFLYRLVEADILRGGFATAVRIFWVVTPKFLYSPLAGGRVVIDGGEIQLSGNSFLLVLWAVAWLAGLLAVAIVAATRQDI